MIGLLLFVGILVLLWVIVFLVLPRSPRWVAVSFWAVVCLLAVFDNHAFFAALNAIFATQEFYTHDR